MTIITHYVSTKYKPEMVEARYVRYAGGGVYKWCETAKGLKYDIRQGACDISDLPPDIAMKAIDLHNQRVWPSYVAWPVQ